MNLRLLSLLCATVPFSVLGCGSDIELGDAHGIVTLDGKPLEGATIRFIPIGGGRSALGRTDEKGYYEMLYSATATGALVGPVRVEITTAEEVNDAAGNSRMQPEKLPARYHTDSELTAEVGSGNNEFNFDLTSN